jgi:hypothetical protein
MELDEVTKKVSWPFSEHKVFVYFCLNNLHRLEAVQNVKMRMDTVDLTP